MNESDPNGTDAYIITYGSEHDPIGTHSAIAIDWPGTSPIEYDFGPTGPDRPVTYWIHGAAVPGEVVPTKCAPTTLSETVFTLSCPTTYSHPHFLEEPSYIIRIHTTAAQDKAIRKWLISTESNTDNNWKGAYGLYDGLNRQCSSYVNDALKAGGIDTGLGRDPKGDSILAHLGENIFESSVGGAYYATVKPAELRFWALTQPGSRTIWHKSK